MTCVKELGNGGLRFKRKNDSIFGGRKLEVLGDLFAFDALCASFAGLRNGCASTPASLALCKSF